MNLTDKKVAVLGAGSSGKAAARLAMVKGAQVQVFDTSDSVTNWPDDISLVTGATVATGQSFDCDLVVISPGIETDCEFVKSFSRANNEIIGELELACRYFSGKIIAITGTNGKTTTTSLIEKILTEAGIKAVACGNYGVPVADVVMREDMPEALALEVSSFQLETIKQFHPNIAIWLNFAPDHMDRYTKVEDYYQAKLRIFENQTDQDLAIVRAHEKLPELRAKTETFSTEDHDATLYYEGTKIMESGKELVDLCDTTLFQRHNAENVMSAILATRQLGVSLDSIKKTLASFAPPGHRCEVVRKLNDVLWLNDSKATNLHALEAAVKSQDAPVILIAGGKDKGLDYTPVTPLLKQKVKACIVFGQITEQLYRDFSSVVPCFKASDVADCVSQAAKLAQAGDVVLFSPGTSSFDMFTGYVQRGQAFRDAVNQLENPTL